MSRARTAATLLAAIVALALPTASGAAAIDPTAASAAGHVARQLEANRWQMPSSSDSTGLSIDAVVMLASTGAGADAARATLDRISTDAPAWLAATPVGDEGQRAKLMFALQVGGRDTSTLETELRAAIATDGRVGARTTVFGQSWAVLALARTPAGAPSATVGRLLALQCTTAGHANLGGFGFGSCNTVDGDATGMAVLALLAAGRAASDPVLVSALAWMQSHQLADGSFPAQLSPRTGNTNSTGLVALAARQLGSPAAITIADSAAAYVRELQVTCASPLITGDDPSVGGGFPVTWLGAIAYDDAAQDAAIADGVPPGRLTQWRYATLQAPLALPGMRALGSLSLAGAAAGVEPAASCPKPAVEPPTPTGTSPLGAASFVVRTSSRRPVSTGARIQVRATGLATREPYTIVMSGRVLARGVAPTTGVVSRRIVVLRSFGSHPRRVLRVLGASARRTGSTTVATAAPRHLFVAAPRDARRGARIRISVRGLLPLERVRVTLAGRVVAHATARRAGRTTLVLPIRSSAQRQRIVVCGTTCSRRGVATIRVVR